MPRLLQGVLFLLLTGSLCAQPKEQKEAPYSYATAGLNYLTDYVYLGRADSLRLPYLSPVLGYYHRSGVFAEASASWLLRSDSGRLDMGTLRAGYLHEGDNWSAGIAAEKYFYNNSSTNIRSEIGAGIDGRIGYAWKGLGAELLTGLSLGDNTDYWLSLGISYELQADDGKFRFTPGAMVNGSTRNFYGSYYGQRRLRKNNALAQVTAKVNDASRFRIMNYEFSFPLEYSLGQFTLALTPVYSIAVSQAVTSVTIKPQVGPTINRVVYEKLKNRFYGSVDLYYTLF